ncbi:hypothetical protein [Acetobacter fallax]|uniref:hypothetical protein n=1 Tax=Acetobacter fallax TaxID=1737473 RepID=UPI001F54F7AC|nr:hypothetical protein [Acetobacter fallax]
MTFRAWGMGQFGDRTLANSLDETLLHAPDAAPLHAEHHIELTWQAPVWRGDRQRDGPEDS